MKLYFRYVMKKLFFLIVAGLFFGNVFAQDSINVAYQGADTPGIIRIFKDPRLNTFAKKELEYNESLAYGPKSGKGFRLMLLSTNDRNLAMNIRAQLLQKFPDQKVYMSFQPPNIKLKFGNFVEKEEAEKYKKEIARQKIISNNIYIVPEIVEIKVDKTKELEANK